MQERWSVFILPEKNTAVCSWKVGITVLFVTLLCELFRHAPDFFYPWLYVLYTVCTLCRSQRFHGSVCVWLHIFRICRHLSWATPPVFFSVRSRQQESPYSDIGWICSSDIRYSENPTQQLYCISQLNTDCLKNDNKISVSKNRGKVDKKRTKLENEKHCFKTAVN